MNTSHTDKKREPRIRHTIRSDFRQTKIKEEFKSEYKDLKQYFLTEERKKKLRSMNAFKKFFVLPWWLLKAMYFRLTPFRRILLFIGLIGLITSGNFSTGSDGTTLNLNLSTIFTSFIFLFILALELKDKLLAKTELQEGKAIQQSLMPDQSPKVIGWDIWLFTRSANDVGGDLLDFIQIDENKYGVAVGDVAGKGLSAALLMAKLQSTIRALVYDYPSLETLGDKLNKIFHRDSPSKIFASLIYIEINSELGNVKFINAGHYPPILARNEKVEQLEKDAPALGLIKDATFNKQLISLDQNDFMIIYSDGLTEAKNELGEFFGETKLIKLLTKRQTMTSQQLGEMIIANVDGFIGKIP
ncbi:MAG TPA: PP2C family protein-serine/threonine phosphatase, partial [Ignavibacteriaceae bacterium]